VSIFALTCLSQVLMTAENALLPTLIPAGQETRANSLNALNNNLARLAGPALGGVVTAFAGLGAVAVIDAATFLAAAALVAAIRGRERGTAAAATADGAAGPARPRLWTDLVSGLAVIRGSHQLRVIFRFLAIISVGEGVMAVLIVVFTERALGGGARELGLIISAQAVGGVLGGLLGGVVGDRVPTRWLVGAGTALIGVGDLVIFNYPRWYPELWPALAIMALVGIPAALLNAGVMTVLQTAVADRWRGRVFGAALTVMALLSMVGTLLAAALGDRFGPVAVLNVQGVGLIVGGLYVLAALRVPVTGVIHATERSLTTARRTG
jgi:predicted MFS family arabinose efflux permease